MVRFLTRDYPTTNGRFRRATGWEPRYPRIGPGLEAVVRRWLDADLLVPTLDGYALESEVPTKLQCRTCGDWFRPITDACPRCQSGNLIEHHWATPTE
jgi:hypothetical protein